MISVLAELYQGVNSASNVRRSKAVVLNKGGLEGDRKQTRSIAKSYAAKKLPANSFGYKTKTVTVKNPASNVRSRIPSIVPAA